MNKKTIVASLAEIANTLDINNLHKEASDITKVMVKVAQEITGNQVVYRVMKRMFGADYNKMPDLNKKLYEMRQELFDAVTEEAEKLGVEPSAAIMRLNEAFDKTGKGPAPARKMPMFKDRGVMSPSTVSPDQKTDEYDPSAPDYETHTKPMYDKAIQWINKSGNVGPSQAKKDAFDQMKAGSISPQLYAVIEEILLPRIMKIPARPPMMGPTKRNK